MPKGQPKTKQGLVNKKRTQYKPKGSKAFDAGIYLNLHSEDKNRLKEIEGWPDKLRNAITQLIEAEAVKKEEESNAA